MSTNITSPLKTETRREAAALSQPRVSQALASSVLQYSLVSSVRRPRVDQYPASDDNQEETLRRTGAGLPQQWKALADIIDLNQKRRKSRDSAVQLDETEDPEIVTAGHRRLSLDARGSPRHLSLLSALDSEDGALAKFSPGFLNQSLFPESLENGDDERGEDDNYDEGDALRELAQRPLCAAGQVRRWKQRGKLRDALITDA